MAHGAAGVTRGSIVGDARSRRTTTITAKISTTAPAAAIPAMAGMLSVADEEALDSVLPAGFSKKFDGGGVGGGGVGRGVVGGSVGRRVVGGSVGRGVGGGGGSLQESE